MSHWLDNSKKNLIPLSFATSFHDALREWVFTGTVIDYENDDDEIVCELCEHPHLAHHYEISNRHNGNALLVGSSCILKFEEIEVQNVLGEVITDQEERRYYLNEALQRKRLEDALQPLRELYKINKLQRSRIETNANILKNGQGISPNELLFLFNSMRASGIQYRPKLYKVSLRAFHEPAELVGMNSGELALLRPALSVTQLKRYSKLFGGEQ